jgi:hypothetical protein
MLELLGESHVSVTGLYTSFSLVEVSFHTQEQTFIFIPSEFYLAGVGLLLQIVKIF